VLFNLTINVSPRQICAELEKPSHPVSSNSDFIYNMDKVHVAPIEIHVRDAVLIGEKMAKSFRNSFRLDSEPGFPVN
jgi:hypothetical protein